MNPPPASSSPLAAASVTELTATAQDYLKAIWSATEWDGEPATVKSLAARFGVSPASASGALRRLAADGLVDHERYGSIALTEPGQRHALAMVRRHRLIETFLARMLDYSPDEVHDEAEHLEHTISELFLDRVDALLGRPTVDPHGDPIPTRDGVITFPPHALHLAAAPSGEYTVARLSDRDPERLAHLTAGGIGPGSQVTVQRQNAYSPIVLTAADGTTLALNEYTADGIYLTPIEA